MSNINNLQIFKEQLRTFSLPNKIGKHHGHLVPRSYTASFYRTIQKKPKLLTKSLNICKQPKFRPLTSEQLKLLTDQDTRKITHQSITVQNLKQMIAVDRARSYDARKSTVDNSFNNVECQLAKSALDIVHKENEEKERQNSKLIQKVVQSQHRLSIRGPVKFKSNMEWYDQSQMSKPFKSKYQTSSQHSQNKKSIRLASENSNEIEGLTDKSQTEVFNEIVLYDNNKEQMEVVQLFVKEQYGQKYPLHKSETNKFIRTLHHQVKLQYLNDYLIWQPLSSMNDLTIAQDLQNIYGDGKYRWLFPGEECLIIQTMHSIIKQFAQKIELICQSVPSKFVFDNERNYQYHFELVQVGVPKEFSDLYEIKCHWKIMATRFRCSKLVNFSDRLNMRIAATAQARGHFLDLTKTSNLLVKYLWKHSSLYDRDTEQNL